MTAPATRSALATALADAEALADRLRAALAEIDAAAPVAGPNKPEGPPEFLPHDLIDTGTAAQRAGVPQDTIRFWCRQDPSLGCKVGGRVFVSSPRLSDKLKLRSPK